MEEIERIAEDFPAHVPGNVWDGQSLPVPIEDIADMHVELVRDVDDLSAAPGAPHLDEAQSLSDLLLPALGEIWVNAGEAREWPPGRRFTIAHELGHWTLHRHDGQCSALKHDRARHDCGASRASCAREEANAFGAALLMPARLIREQYARCDRDFSRLCDTFGASGAAMGRRLHAVIKPGAIQDR